uniref:Uncharacterized protein n=1 Tax=Anguilla anguilla TaxID=7936 RepID=A0A0E9WYQ3_ANGAN
MITSVSVTMSHIDLQLQDFIITYYSLQRCKYSIHQKVLLLLADTYCSMCIIWTSLRTTLTKETV